MKRIIYILFCLALLGVSCKKQECLTKDSKEGAVKKGAFVPETDGGTSSTTSGSGQIVDTDDEDDNSSNKRRTKK